MEYTDIKAEVDRLPTVNLSLRDQEEIWGNLAKEINKKGIRGFGSYVKGAFAATAAVAVCALVFVSVGEHSNSSASRTTAVSNQSQQIADISNVKAHALGKGSADWNGIPVKQFAVSSTDGWQSYAVPSSPVSIKALALNTAMHDKTKTNAKIYNLQASRQKASFPIREPSGISGWTVTESEGIESPYEIQEPTFTTVTFNQITYYDLYTNNVSGDQISVWQGAFESPVTSVQDNKKVTVHYFPPHSIMYFPGAQLLSGFSHDLAILFAEKGHPYQQLIVYHKESNGRITTLKFNGTNAQTLEEFAKIYLSSQG